MRGRFRRTKRLLFRGGVRLLQALATTLPRRAALGLFSEIGNVVRTIDRPAVRRSQAHLAIALGSELSPSAREVIVRRMFRALGRNLVDLLRRPPAGVREIDALVEFEGLEHLDRSLKRGRGVVALSAHLGNWEILGAALAARGYPLHVAPAPLFDRRSDRILNDWRRSRGIRVHPRENGLAPLLQALRAGEVVGALVDQDAPGRGVFVDFFGHPARTVMAPFVLARRTGASLVPMWTHLGADGRHRVRVLPELAPTGLSGRARGLRDVANAWHRILEAAIREHPEQWVWYHRRWKTRPPNPKDLRKFSNQSAYLTSFQGSRRRVFAR